MFHTNKKRSYNILGRLNKRGQFTMFVILGMVIFAAFSFALYARAKIINSQMIIQADTQIKDYLNKNSVNQYVTSCLDSVTEETILLASMQGGLLDSTDKIINQDYVEYNDSTRNRTFNVSIAVDTNEFCLGNSDPAVYDPSLYIVTQQPEHYPYNCRNVYLDELPSIYNVYGITSSCENSCIDYEFLDYSGFFGINKLPILCNPVGGNAPRSGINTITCDYYDYYKKSMQQLLEEHIASKISDCVNFTKVISQTSSNITKVGDSRVRITFNKGSFSVRLQYPFTIILRNKQPVTRMVDFGIEKDLPFKELYDYSYELANDDIKNVKFDVINNRDTVISQRRGIRLYNSYYTVSNFFGDSNNNYTDIIQVQDTAHKLRGIPLTMNIAVRNRRPALEFISENRSQQYDIVTSENKTITINPQGYDPDDEKALTYSYGGWHEDRSEHYDWTNELCNGSLPTTLEYIINSCTIPDDTIPPEYLWSNSQLYLDTSQNASYNTTHEDTGFHIVKVSVSDRSSLEDYQFVRILVFDLPEARINGSNDYPEVPQDWASREDFYLLSGKESVLGTLAKATGAIFDNFLWVDGVETFAVRRQIDMNNVDTMNLRIPQDVDGDSTIDIMNIPQYTFKDSNLPQTHNIDLTVTNTIPLSGTATFPVIVQECLPHRSDVPSYPYNVNPGTTSSLEEALQANHTCCADEGTYEPAGSVCYNPILYGIENNFVDYSQYDPAALFNPDTPYQNIQGYDNDILVQNFARTCNGLRGNICTGDITETRDVAQSCPDDNPDSNGNPTPATERCWGPPQDLFTTMRAYDALPQCEQYSSTTFEKLLSDNGIGANIGTGRCTGDNPQYSADRITWDPNGQYLCDGTCDGTNGCVPSNCRCGSSNGDNFYCDGRLPTEPARDAAGGRVCDANGDQTSWTICSDSCQLESDPNYSPTTCMRGTDCSTTLLCNGATKMGRVMVGNPAGNLWCDDSCRDYSCGIYKYDINTNQCFQYPCTSPNQCSSNSCNLATGQCN